jgi:two-component system cell cycle response regulator CpdR
MATILLAEDDTSMRLFLAAALRRAGHEVEAVGDGQSALNAVKDGTFDLLLADIVMPGMDGIELARRAAVVAPSLKLMFITGFAAIAMKHRHYAGRTAQVLSKPFHLRDLVAQVDRLLAG